MLKVALSYFKTTGGRPMKESVTKQPLFSMQKQAKTYTVAPLLTVAFINSVKSALAKIEKFDDAAKRYGDL